MVDWEPWHWPIGNCKSNVTFEKPVQRQYKETKYPFFDVNDEPCRDYVVNHTLCQIAIDTVATFSLLSTHPTLNHTTATTACFALGLEKDERSDCRCSSQHKAAMVNRLFHSSTEMNGSRSDASICCYLPCGC